MGRVIHTDANRLNTAAAIKDRIPTRKIFGLASVKKLFMLVVGLPTVNTPAISPLTLRGVAHIENRGCRVFEIRSRGSGAVLAL